MTINYLKGWRTIGVMAVFAVLGLLQQADWVQLVPTQYVPLAVSLVGAVGMILRAVTSTPVGVKQ